MRADGQLRLLGRTLKLLGPYPGGVSCRRRVASDRDEERPESWQRSANPRAEEKPSDLGWCMCSRLWEGKVHTEDQTAVHPPRVPACDRRHFVVLRVTQEGQGLAHFLPYV